MPVMTIPARTGAHVLLHPSQRLKVISPSGTQVVDTWIFPLDARSTWMSTSQTRSILKRLVPCVGDTFVDTSREPVVTWVEDTSPGVHDMLYPACDEQRYAQAGYGLEHPSCGGILKHELGSYLSRHAEPSLFSVYQAMVEWRWTPEPLNLFMNVPVASMEGGAKGALEVKGPVCTPGDYVVLEAKVKCLVVLSACPNDLMDTNAGAPSDAAYEVLLES